VLQAVHRVITRLLILLTRKGVAAGRPGQALSHRLGTPAACRQAASETGAPRRRSLPAASAAQPSANRASVEGSGSAHRRQAFAVLAPEGRCPAGGIGGLNDVAMLLQHGGWAGASG